MKIVPAVILLAAVSAFAQPGQTLPKPQAVAFFDVLDLPARIDGPELKKTDNGYLLTCAVANRSAQTMVGLRLTLMFVDSSNDRITRLTWNEATDLPAYSIKTFEFNPRIKDELKPAKIFLGVEEVIGRETVWRTVDADKLLRAYARGQQGTVPKVQAVQNKFDREFPRAISETPRLPKP
jgi:hypothetical protein